jgi:nitrite reductase/ring-hydroxylating ferredoxin subunit
MPGFHRVGSVTDFSEGLVRVFPVEDVHIAVVTYGGRFHAFSGLCPHAHYNLNYTRVREDSRILCSSHFAWFDLATGQVLSGPTEDDLTQYPVRVEGEDVLVSPKPLGGEQA